MIQSFADRDTAELFYSERSQRFANVARVALRKLIQKRQFEVAKMTNPITPGEILAEEYLKPMGISQSEMAMAIGVAPRTIDEIVLGQRAITPAMSVRFGRFFGQSDEFWHGIQVECDARKHAPAKP